jgi:3-mercaptopyruvate sulfurtransferase SseA
MSMNEAGAHISRRMLPTPEAFSRSMSTLGIGDDATIVIYELGVQYLDF